MEEQDLLSLEEASVQRDEDAAVGAGEPVARDHLAMLPLQHARCSDEQRVRRADAGGGGG
eukprot:753977-Hanusia_phi.AAC.1